MKALRLGIATIIFVLGGGLVLLARKLAPFDDPPWITQDNYDALVRERDETFLDAEYWSQRCGDAEARLAEMS